MDTYIKRICGLLIASCGLSLGTPIGGLDLVSSSSTFETNGTVSNPLPFYGWVNTSGTARVFDWSTSLNGAMIGTTAYGNYEVLYDTGVSVQPNMVYTLSVDIGYIAALTGGNSGYRLEVGSVDGLLNFTPFATVTGTVSRLADMALTGFSGSATVTATTGSLVNSDTMAVRWAQISTLGSPFSDYFGFDNVLLDASPTPEPLTVLSTLAGLGLLALRRRT
ncbi:MAG: PEP-CTERM sorting domain-containing protein [Bryobacteraceae bacterium]